MNKISVLFLKIISASVTRESVGHRRSLTGGSNLHLKVKFDLGLHKI